MPAHLRHMRASPHGLEPLVNQGVGQAYKRVTDLWCGSVLLTFFDFRMRLVIFSLVGLALPALVQGCGCDGHGSPPKIQLTPPTRPLVWGDINIIHTTDSHGWLLGHQKASFPEPNYRCATPIHHSSCQVDEYLLVLIWVILPHSLVT